MKKKILFISSLSSVFHEPLWKAFETLGFEVHFVDYRGSSVLALGNPIHRVVGRLPEGMKQFLNRKANQGVDHVILEAARRVRPNYIFASKAKYIDVAVLDELRRIAPTINWYSDILNNIGTIKKIVDHYDFMFNYDRYMVEQLRADGHHNFYHLPWAGDIDKNEEWLDKKEYKYDFVFIGSYHPEIFPREDDFKALKDLGIKIWGNRAWLNTALKDCYMGLLPPVFENMKRVYQNSKIALYLDSLYDVKASGVTLRPFEITCGGAMMLGQIYREELPELWQDGKEFISFKGIDDLREKVRYYLSHEDERRRIAKAGFERTRQEHTYLDRVRRVFAIVDANYPIIQ